MFKRIFASLLVVLALSPGVLMASSEDNPSRPDIVGFGTKRYGMTDGTTGSTIPVVINYDGSIIPARNVEQNLGKSTQAWNQIYGNFLTVNQGITNHREEWIDVSSASPTGLAFPGGNFAFTFATSAVSNQGQSISTPVASGLGAFALVQSSCMPRNIIIQSSHSFVAALTTTTLSGSATFYGVNNLGRVTSENILFSTTIVQLISTATISNAGLPPVAWRGVGNVPWAYISSVTLSLSSTSATMADLSYSVAIGWGNKFGLANTIATSSSVYKVTVNGSDVTLNPSLLVDTTYYWIAPPIVPGGLLNSTHDISVHYTSPRSPR